jgi:hypothetical protein
MAVVGYSAYRLQEKQPIRNRTLVVVFFIRSWSAHKLNSPVAVIHHDAHRNIHSSPIPGTTDTLSGSITVPHHCI